MISDFTNMTHWGIWCNNIYIGLTKRFGRGYPIPMRPVSELAIEILSGESALGFSIYNKAWYYDSNKRFDDIKQVALLSLGLMHEEGGTSGEFEMVWEMLSEKHPFARMKAFDDSWHIFPLVGSFFAMLARVSTQSNKPSISDDAMVDELKTLGWRDLTSYERQGADGFKRIRRTGAIPADLRAFFEPRWTHYASIENIPKGWTDRLQGDHLIVGEGDVLLMTNHEDALLARMTFND